MNKLLILCIGVLVAGLLPGHAAKAQSDSSEDDILRIRSNGRTRIEIHSGNQVALYTGGVQFEYRDYRLSAEKLRYSQAENFAEATGNVLLEQTGSRLATERVEIYIDENLLVCPGKIEGALAKDGLGFMAARAEARLNEQPGNEQSTFLIALTENVSVYSDEGYSFQTSKVTMDTSTGFVNVPQTFNLRLPGNGGELQPSASQPLMLSDLMLTGASMSGKLDEDMQLRSLHALATEIRGEQLQFSAGSVKASFLDNGHDGIMIDLLATGSPVRGTYRQPGDDLSFSAESIAGTIDPGYGSQFLLSGGIDLSAELALLKSDVVSVVQDMQGVRIVFPEGLEAGLALDEISGNEDLDLSEILHR